MAQEKSIETQTPQDAEKDALETQEMIQPLAVGERFDAYRMPGCNSRSPASAASLS
jgi:hypothetical protein